MNHELSQWLTEVRELLLWERTLSGIGLPAGGAPTSASSAGAEVATSESAPSVSQATAVSQATNDELARRRSLLEPIARECASCTRCGLHATRTKSVFHRGSAVASVVFVGEGPGFNEDQQGEPFVGPAGQLLDRMIAAMGFERDAVYVCNIVKCRPPENRTPLPNEAAACAPFLEQQLAIVQPRVIVALGRCAAENLGCTEPGAKGWRGVWKTWRGVDVMPTYHPAFLLRSPQFKRPVWEDLQKVMGRLAQTA